MPIVKRGQSKSDAHKAPEKNLNGAGITKRIPPKNKLIYTSREGLLIVKTPAETTKWPTDFRLRIVRDYVPPKQLMPLRQFKEKYIDTGDQDHVYRLGQHEVMVKQPFEIIESSSYVVVLRTEVIDVKNKKAMFLYHDAPAMRCLMTWAFLKGKTVPGMPKLSVYEWSP
jgi:hypothetical protein